MKKVILFVITIVILGLLVFRFAERRREVATRTIAQIQAEEGYPVEVDKIQTGTFNLDKRLTGTVVGGKQSVVVSMLSEHISIVKVREGQYVEKDEVICELSRDNPSASYTRAKLALENAEKELARVRSLFNEGAISQQVLDGTQLQRDLSADAVKSIEQLLFLRAPFAGTVTELEAEVGKLVNPGQPVAKIVSNETARVEVEVPARDRDLIKVGAACAIASDGNSIPGRVQRISLSADPESRMFTAWISFDIDRQKLQFSPGLLVDITVNVLQVENALLASPKALIREGELWFVYTIQDNRAKLQQIDLGGQNRDAAWIRSGVNPEDLVVISGASLLVDGAPVRIMHNAGEIAAEL
jgi:membrane fusion protein (multidrug efflux system)